MEDIPASQPGLASLQMSQTASPLSPGRVLGCRPRGEGSWLMGCLLVHPLCSTSDAQSPEKEEQMGPQPPGAPGTSLSLQAVPGTQASGVASDQGTEAKQRCWAKVSSCLAPVGGQTGFFEKWKHDFRPAGDVPHPSHVKCDLSSPGTE